MEIPKQYKIKKNIWCDYEMYYSEAFNCLNASAIKTFLRCLQKRKWEHIKTHGKKKTIFINEDFIFPYAEAAALNIAHNTQHWKNMNKLIEVGFLDLVHQGGFYQQGKRDRDYNVYKLSERWRNYGTADFKETEKKKSLPKSSHIQKHLERKQLKTPSLKRNYHLHNSEVDRPKTDNFHIHNSEDNKAEQKTPESLVNSA